jgi:hypothetical protein
LWLAILGPSSIGPSAQRTGAGKRSQDAQNDLPGISAIVDVAISLRKRMFFHTQHSLDGLCAFQLSMRFGSHHFDIMYRIDGGLRNPGPPSPSPLV